MEFPEQLMVRIEDTDAEPIYDAPTDQSMESLSEVWDNGTRFGVYRLVEVKTMLCERKVEVI